MASFDKYFPHLIRSEGGFVDHPDDKGGPTKYGVILKQWIALGYDKDKDGDIDVDDLKIITISDAAEIAKPHYWDKVKGDQINSQSVAEFLADWAYNSGVKTAIKKLQEVLGLAQDGFIGPVTLAKVNAANPKVLFEQLKARREKFYRGIVAINPSQVKFLKGWLNRLKTFEFKG